MNILTIVALGFLVMESMNVLTLYFFPGSKLANGVGVFKAWEKSKNDPEVHDFIKYLVNWVAGTKLIFILLLIVILVAADDHTQILAGIAMVVSILSFYWRLYPLIRKMDLEGQIEPAQYSRTLAWMIAAFVLMFGAAVVVSILG
jgi:hypothetical protein